MNWNLVWTPGESTGANTCNSKFVFYLGDEPILTKKMNGQICQSQKKTWLTFVETMYKFSFENFNEFVMDFQKSTQAKISFDVWDGQESFVYDSDTDRLIIAFELYTSNMVFSISIDDRTRIQFVKEFNKFQNHYLEFFETSSKHQN